MLDYEILKQAIKENEEQENEQLQIEKEKRQLQREKLQLEREKLEHKKQEMENKKSTLQKTNNTSIILSIILSFGVLAFTMIFYIVLLLKI